MKSITTYINEQYSKIQLHEVIVKFPVENSDIVVEIPDTFMEDQINTYLDDTIINNTFVGDEYSTDLFGKNAQYISDVYFEYTGINDTSLSVDIKWDNNYDVQNVKNGKLKRVKIDNFKFVVTFEHFELLDDKTDDESIQESLKTVFERCVSDEFEWPVHFILDDEEIEFRR